MIRGEHHLGLRVPGDRPGRSRQDPAEIVDTFSHESGNWCRTAASQWCPRHRANYECGGLSFEESGEGGCVAGNPSPSNPGRCTGGGSTSAGIWTGDCRTFLPESVSDNSPGFLGSCVLQAVMMTVAPSQRSRRICTRQSRLQGSREIASAPLCSPLPDGARNYGQQILDASFPNS